jgi:hypothetical protein
MNIQAVCVDTFLAKPGTQAILILVLLTVEAREAFDRKSK